MTLIVIDCPSHYLNVMKSVIIFQDGLDEYEWADLYTHSGYFCGHLGYYFAEYTLDCSLLG